MSSSYVVSSSRRFSLRSSASGSGMLRFVNCLAIVLYAVVLVVYNYGYVVLEYSCTLLIYDGVQVLAEGVHTLDEGDAHNNDECTAHGWPAWPVRWSCFDRNFWHDSPGRSWYPNYQQRDQHSQPERDHGHSRWLHPVVHGTCWSCTGSVTGAAVTAHAVHHR